MWSAIFRMSIDDDSGTRVRNKVVPVLQSAGFTNEGTGSWRLTSEDRKKVAGKLSEVLQILADPENAVTNPGPNVAMDHVWIYIERVHPAALEQPDSSEQVE